MQNPSAHSRTRLCILCLFVLSIPSYLQDTVHLLQLNEVICVPPTAWLVKSMLRPYIAAAHRAKASRSYVLSCPRKATRRFISFCLTMFFAFQAPTSSRYKAWLSALTLTYIWRGGSTTFFPAMTPQCTCAMLYHGTDTLMIFSLSGMVITLYCLNFFAKFNQNNWNLQFTMSCDQYEEPFLDFLIRKDNNGYISSALYRKPTAGNTMLHDTSAHPASLICSIPYGQYLWLKRNCSDIDVFETEAKCLHDRLHAKGCSKKCLANIALPNGKKFAPKKFVNCQTQDIVYLMTCDCGSFYVGKTIREFWRHVYDPT